MGKIWGAITGALVSAALLAPASGAAIQVPTGDTCVASGGGTAYTLVITLPTNAPEQAGFAFGAPGGVKVNAVKVQETSGGGGGSQRGTFTTANLPTNATAAWHLGNPAAVPGAQITASLTTSGPVTGSFTVIPMNPVQGNYFDAFACALSQGRPQPSNAFTPQKRATYNSKNGTWNVLVTIPGRGTLIFVHKTVAVGGTPSPLVQAGKVSAKTKGKYKLTLRLSAAGRAALNETGAVKVSLNIQYSPSGGKPANKVVTLTLRK